MVGYQTPRPPTLLGHHQQQAHRVPQPAHHLVPGRVRHAPSRDRHHLRRHGHGKKGMARPRRQTQGLGHRPQTALTSFSTFHSSSCCPVSTVHCSYPPPCPSSPTSPAPPPSTAPNPTPRPRASASSASTKAARSCSPSPPAPPSPAPSPGAI